MDLRAMLNTDGAGDRGGGAGTGAAAATAAAAAASVSAASASVRGTATTPGAGGGINAPSSSSRQPSQPPGPGPVAMRSPSISMNGIHGTPSSSSVAPVTPIQTGPPHNAFRDYGHSTHASPVMQHHDYPPPAGPYQSPTSYHPPPPAGPFANRPHVPPIQPPGHDTRSPGSVSMPAPSPYRNTPPASSINPSNQGYPFPPTSQPPPPASPSQRQQYGSQAGFGSRDSYSSNRQLSPAPPPIGMPSRMPSHGSAASAASYGQGQQQQHRQQQAMPQTPPVGTPGGMVTGSGSGTIGPGGVIYIQHPSHQHQRSLSVQSIPTPTSAHSQQPPFGPPYMQGSPVATTHQALPQHHLDHHQQSQRQSSQPPTPLGPPMSGPIRQSPATTYREPLSPYQQRTSSYPPQQSQSQQQQHQHQHQQSMQTSPPPPAPASIQQQHKNQILLQQQQLQHQQRLSNSHSAFEVTATAVAAAESHRRSMSQHSRSERERSISVSPKTRVPSLPSSSSSQDILHHPPSRPLPLSQSHSQTQQLQLPPQPQPQPQPQLLSLPSAPATAAQPAPALPQAPPAMDPQRDVTPAKRKLDDRNLSPEELQNYRRPPPPGAVSSPGTNGNHVSSDSSPLISRAAKRVKYSSPPPWAQAVKGRHLNASRNFSLKQHVKRAASGGKLVNGNAHHQQDGAGVPIKAEHSSPRHASPETTRSAHATSTPGAVKIEDHPMPDPQHPLPTNAAPAPAIEPPPPPPQQQQKDPKTFNGKYFPWEATIENQKPIDLFSKAIGDFIYYYVLNNPNLEEIRSRGVQFEIEAKLGTAIDKSTNDRISLPLKAGECVFDDAARIAFRSSMTEAQHRILNQWLNQQVQETHPRNPRAASRLEVKYKHRRETDRFFELPASQYIQRLPHCISKALPTASTLKARVTYDQTTGEVLAKIIKGRVADLNLHFPHLPLDCRVSINLEWDWEGPAEEIIHAAEQMANRRERLPDRNKDRLSYTHGFYQVDLTQVTQGGGDGAGAGGAGGIGGKDKEHELEIELDANVVLEHGNLIMHGMPNRYENLIDGFVDNIRVLARKCPPNP